MSMNKNFITRQAYLWSSFLNTIRDFTASKTSFCMIPLLVKLNTTLGRISKDYDIK